MPKVYLKKKSICMELGSRVAGICYITLRERERGAEGQREGHTEGDSWRWGDNWGSWFTVSTSRIKLALDP